MDQPVRWVPTELATPSYEAAHPSGEESLRWQPSCRFWAG